VNGIRNLILSKLPAAELDVLAPDLAPVELPIRRRIAAPNEPIDQVHFIESGMISLVGDSREALPTEIGVIGREGVANLAALLEAGQSPYRVMVQVAGRARSLDVEAGRAAMRHCPEFNRLVRQFAHAFIVQTSSSVFANARGSGSERLARWLLMARDRIEQDRMTLTHEFLSIMLGMRRPTVTLLLRDFEERGWIARSRGCITLLDHEALLAEAGQYYGQAEAEIVRLYGPDPQ
jgi:CRP-like cAMP-binding protein